MTKENVAELITMNYALYKLGSKPLTDAEQKAMLDVWYWHFKDHDSTVVKTAFLKANAVCKFPIQPADIFEQLQQMATENMEPAAKMWDDFLKIARKISNNATCYGYTFRLPSGKTQGQDAREKNAELFESLPKEVQEWCGGISTATEIGNMPDSDAQRFERPRFLKDVDAQRQTTKNILELKTAPQFRQIAGATGCEGAQ